MPKTELIHTIIKGLKPNIISHIGIMGNKGAHTTREIIAEERQSLGIFLS